MFREFLVSIMLSQVGFNLKTKLVKRHINVGHCYSFGKENVRHFFDRVTVAWRHQTMTSHLSSRTATFKHHCKISKCQMCTLYKFYIIPSYNQRGMRVVSELFDPPTYVWNMFSKFRVINGEYIVRISRGIVELVYEVKPFGFMVWYKMPLVTI